MIKSKIIPMIIREAKPEDAEQIISYIQRLDSEPESMLPRAPGEFNVTVEQERKLLAAYAEADNSLYIVAPERWLHCWHFELRWRQTSSDQT